MFVTMGIAPLPALIIPTILWKEHKDSVIGSGPFVTVLQDLLSLIIYFYIDVYKRQTPRKEIVYTPASDNRSPLVISNIDVHSIKNVNTILG